MEAETKFFDGLLPIVAWGYAMTFHVFLF
jgi:hypothetical protein